MQHSIKYRIPAIVVKTRDEVLADKRQRVIDQVLANSSLNANQKMRLFETALYRRLADEHKLDQLLPPPPAYEFESQFEPVHEEEDPAVEDDTTTAIEDDTATAVLEDTTTAQENSDDERRESMSWIFPSPRRRKSKLKSGFVPVYDPSNPKTSPPTPGYMQPLKRNSLPSSPVSSHLRANRPPPGHFKGNGRLRVVRWQ